MHNPFRKLAILVFILSIAGCSSNPSNPHNSITQSISNIFQSSSSTKSEATSSVQPIATTATTAESETPTVAMGGSIRKSMDGVDMTKLSRAMDKSPGKATHWENGATGISYTVVPIRAVTVNGNHYCRKYTLTAEHAGNQRSTTGVACVGDDTNWKDVSA